MKIDFFQWFGGYFDSKGTISLRIRKNGNIKPIIQIRGKKPVLEMIRKELNLKKKLQFHRYTKSHMDRISHCAEGDWTIDLVSKNDIRDFILIIYQHSLLKQEQLGLMNNALNIKDEIRYPSDFKLMKLKEIRKKISELNLKNDPLGHPLG